MTETEAILLAIKCGVQVTVGNKLNPNKNQLNLEALMKLIKEIKNA